MPLVEEIVEKLNIRRKIDELFRKPGSNHGIKSSDYVMKLVYMFIVRALPLEDVLHLESDEAFQEMLRDMKLQASDAIREWLG